jgi:transcriptional regulator with XRE-family HTH domain
MGEVRGLDTEVLAQRLAAARAQAKLSQTELAERCALNLPNLNAIERGKSAGVRAETLVRLAHALGCSLDYLVGLADDPTPPTRRRSRRVRPEEVVHG